MNEFFTIATFILSLLNTGVCAMSDNWTGACGWIVAALSNTDFMKK